MTVGPTVATTYDPTWEGDLMDRFYKVIGGGLGMALAFAVFGGGAWR